MTDFYTAGLLQTKPLSDDDSGFNHCFEVKASLPQTLSDPPVTHNTTKLCWIIITQWDCHIHTDTVIAFLGSFFFIYFLLSDGESPRLVKNVEFELVMKLWHPTSIGNILVIQPFLTYCSCRSSYFSNLC